LIGKHQKGGILFRPSIYAINPNSRFSQETTIVTLAGFNLGSVPMNADVLFDDKLSSSVSVRSASDKYVVFMLSGLDQGKYSVEMNVLGQRAATSGNALFFRSLPTMVS